jgi:hypothetical protein
MKLTIVNRVSLAMICVLGLFVAPDIARAGLEICNDTQAHHQC